MAKIAVFRIVIGSPSEVATEREHVQRIVDELNRTVARANGLHIQLVRWETDAYPGFHPEGVQGHLDPILDIEDADLFIGIFWKHFGTTLPSGETGTEHEFKKAYSSYQSNRRPQIFFYFCKEPYFPSTTEETEQQRRVLQFKREFPTEGLWWEYKDEREFERVARQHVTAFLLKYANDEVDDDAIVLFSKEVKIRKHWHRQIPMNFGKDEGISFSINASDGVDIAIMDTEDYELWESTGEFESSYDIYRGESDVEEEFRAPEDGEFILVVSNDSDHKIKALVHIETIPDEE